jgi:16S rRNA processing protein RimM
MDKTSEYIVLGKIGSTYGIKGWLKVFSFTENAANLFQYTSWYIEDGHHWKPITYTSGRPHGKGIIVKFSGVETPEEARKLTGKKIAIKRSALPALDKNEYYWRDLEGLTVINQEGVTLGTVIYLIETGTNDVLVVKGEKEFAIPYLLNNVIKYIDLEKRIISVDWEVL